MSQMLCSLFVGLLFDAMVPLAIFFASKQLDEAANETAKECLMRLPRFIGCRTQCDQGASC